MSGRSGPTDAGPVCPPDPELVGFLDESLPADRQAALEQHVDFCPDCQRRLDELGTDPSGAVDRCRTLAKTPPSGVRLLRPGDHHGPTQVFSGRFSIPAAVAFDGLPAVPGFEVLAEIGRGGMGVVYKARHKQLNRLVALKVVIAGGSADARTIQRFLFEAEVLARIQHPQVVHVYDVGTYRGACGVPIPYLAMELLEGGTLAALAGRKPQPPRTAAGLVEGLARAVHAVHLQGIVHRDLKPGNILFSAERGARSAERDGGSALRAPRSALPKVSDFGLAKFTEGAGELTGSGQIVGTPGYMSPEQAAGHRQIGPAVDVYALGAILFELLTGRPPFDGSEPMSVLAKVLTARPADVRTARPDVPRDLAAVTMKCLAKEPHRRYASALDLADDLHRYLENRPTQARPAGPAEQLALAVRRNPAVSALMLALWVVIGLGIGTVVGQWRTAQRVAAAARVALDAVRVARAEEAAALRRTEAAQVEKADERRRADQDRLRLAFDRAARWCEDGQVDRGLDGFLDALELAEQLGDAARGRAVRVNLAAWPARTFPRAFAVQHPDRGRPQAACWSADGKTLYTAGELGTIQSWDADTGASARSFALSPWHAGRKLLVPTFWAVAADPTGAWVAAGGSDGQVWVWAAAGGMSRAAWAAAPGKDVWAVAFDPAGRLWTAGGDGRVCRWDPATGDKLAEVPKPSGDEAIAVVADATRVFVGDRGGRLTEWDPTSGAVVRQLNVGGWVTDLALSPDGRQVAATGTRGAVQVWDRATGEEVAAFDLAGAHGAGVGFTPDGQHLAAADADGIVRVWDVAARFQPGVPLRVPGEAHGLRFRPGKPAFAVPAGGGVGVWNMPTPCGVALDADGDPAGGEVRALDFDRDGKRLLVARRHLTVFDAENGKVSRTYRVATPSLTARFDPFAARLLRGDRKTWWAVDAATGVEVAAAGSPGGYVGSVEVAAAGKTVLTAVPTGIDAWDAATGKWARRLEVGGRTRFADPIRVLRVRPDGKEMLVASANRIEFYDPATGSRTRPAVAAADQVEDARYTPDGERVVAGLRNSTAVLLCGTTGKAECEPLPHALAVTAVAVGPDGGVVLTGSRDGTARFWDAATGLALGPPLRHPGPVTAVCYAPDGKRVATGTLRGRARVWVPPPPPAAGTVAELRVRFQALRVWPADPGTPAVAPADAAAP